MTRIFGEKLDWKHVAIVVLVLALVYFIWKHNGIQGASNALWRDLGMIDEKKNPGVKMVKEKHGFKCDSLSCKGRTETLSCKDLSDNKDCSHFKETGTNRMCRDSNLGGCTTCDARNRCCTGLFGCSGASGCGNVC